MKVARKLEKMKLLIALIAFYKLLVSVVVLLPWSYALEASAVTLLPAGDRALLVPGGAFLVEWLRLEMPLVVSGFRASLVLALLAGFFLLFPVALLVSALSDDELSYAKHGRRALSAMPRFVLLFGGTALVQSLFVVLLVLLWGVFSSQFTGSTQAWLLAAWVTIGVAGWHLPNIVQDLARAAVVGQGLETTAALARASRVLLERPATVLGHYAAATLAALLVLVGSAVSTKLLLVDAAADPHIGLAFLVQQGCFLLVVALRAVWLTSALSLVSSSAPMPADTRAGTDAQGDPTPDPAASYE